MDDRAMVSFTWVLRNTDKRLQPVEGDSVILSFTRGDPNEAPPPLSFDRSFRATVIKELNGGKYDGRLDRPTGNAIHTSNDTNAPQPGDVVRFSQANVFDIERS